MKIQTRPINIDELTTFVDKEKAIHKQVDLDDLLYIQPTGDLYEKIFDIYLDDKMVGYICVAKSNPQHCEKLYVSDLHRRSGIAAFAVNQLRILSVWVLDSNADALNFYLSLGFKAADKSGQLLILTRSKAQYQKERN